MEQVESPGGRGEEDQDSGAPEGVRASEPGESEGRFPVFDVPEGAGIILASRIQELIEEDE